MNKKDARDEIRRRGLDVGWACSSRVDTVSRRLLEKMKEAGCFLIYYGIESGSRRILDFVKKGIRIEQVKKAIRWTREVGIKTLGSFMMGFPDETKEEIKETIEFSRRLKLDYVQFSVATPYPGTELYDIARRDGLLLTKDWSHFTAARPVMATRNLSPREIQKLFKEAYIKYYHSPRILLRNMNRYTLPLRKIAARSSLNFKPKTSQGETYP